MKPTRPLLRYFGGKWQLRHWITSHIPPHKFYAEPFAGAASVLLAKEPAPGGEIINDLNRAIITLFRVMQDPVHSEELIRRLDWTPYSKAEFQVSQEPTDDPVEIARRLAIRSFMGIEVAGIDTRGTGFRMGNVDLNRFDQCGQRTFRNCAKDWRGWKDNLHLIRERIAHVSIYERDAFDFIDLMDTAGCLLYIDPPYQHATRCRTCRYQVEFDDEQHQRLVDRLLSARAKVILSGYQTPTYDPLVRHGWRRIRRKYRANMSERSRTETLWLSPNCRP